MSSLAVESRWTRVIRASSQSQVSTSNASAGTSSTAAIAALTASGASLRLTGPTATECEAELPHAPKRLRHPIRHASSRPPTTARRANPERIFQARRDAVRNALTGYGMSLCDRGAMPPATKWVNRYRADGVAGLEGPQLPAERLARALPAATIEAILVARHEPGLGPHRLAPIVGVPRSTVAAELRRLEVDGRRAWAIRRLVVVCTSHR